jgi:hypothetical protein
LRFGVGIFQRDEFSLLRFRHHRLDLANWRAGGSRVLLDTAER